MKLLLDAEVFAHGALEGELTNVRFALGDPEVVFQINDPKIKQWASEPTLEVQVIFEAENFEDGLQRGQDLLKGYFDYLCWITSVQFEVKRLRRLIDWGENIDERGYRVFNDFNGPGLPYQVLSPEVIESAAMVWFGTQNTEIELAVHWFASGVRGAAPEDQFQFFWYGCELVATLHKGKEPVFDICQKCRGKLFCETCGEHPAHKPFDKQALEVMFTSALHFEADRDTTIKRLFKIRNSLLHGTPGHVIEREMDIQIQKFSDKLGHILKGAIFQVINRRGIASVSGQTITFVKASSFARETKMLDLGMMTREKADIDNLSRFVVPEMKMIVTERDEPRE